MKPQTDVLFSSDLWKRALESYASASHLTVTLFDADGSVVFGPINPTPLFQLFEDKGYDPGIFAECARRCLAQNDTRPAVMVSEVYGLAAVGTSMMLEGRIVGAAVAGYAFVDFSQVSEVQRLARDAGIKFEKLWHVARAQKPVPQPRLMLNGELLQVLGDALLRENYRTRQHQQVVIALQEAAEEKEHTHKELEQKASALRESEEQLARELAAAQQLQAASSLLIEGGNADALYQKIVDAAAAIMQSDMASMQLVDGRCDGLRMLASKGFDAQFDKTFELNLPDTRTSSSVARRVGHRVVVPDVETCEFIIADPAALDAHRRAGVRALQSTPLISRAGGILGMISTHWRFPHKPVESDLRQFDVLARQAADLLERNKAAMATASLAAIVESSDDAIISKDLNGIITSWNKGAERLFGYTAEETIGQSITILIPPNRLEEEPSILERVRRGEAIEHLETVRRRKDGKELYISLTVSPIRDSQSRIIGASKIAHDITERRRAEEALRESEERYRTLFDLGPVAIYSCDSSGVIREFNRRAVELWGRTPAPGDIDERFCGSFKLFRPDGSYMPHEQCPMADVVSGRVQGVHDAELLIQRPDGSGVTVIVNIHPLRDQHGEVRGAINCFYDITERKQAEEALREAGKRFRFMAESMPQKIFTATPNGDVDYLNPQWVEFTGASFEQIKDSNWIQFIHPDDVEENVRRWRHSIATGEPFYFEHRVRRADGTYHWHFSRALPMRDASGNIIMWIGSNADIQPVKDQEERLRKAEKMAAAGQLAASLAHEINNPLSSVTNALYLLESHRNLDSSARLFATTAATELARVSRIVKQSLSYYRVGSTPNDLDLGKIVHESLQIFSDKFQRAGIALKPRINDGAVLVGFADELRQVIDNLLLNAMEAMPNGGCLSISLHDSRDWMQHHNHRKGIRLTIADTGCGIPRAQRGRIFEPFFTTKAERGTGLGLWVLQGIILKHDGSLSVRSSDIEGRSGTAISIFLPSQVLTPARSIVANSESAA